MTSPSPSATTAWVAWTPNWMPTNAAARSLYSRIAGGLPPRGWLGPEPTSRTVSALNNDSTMADTVGLERDVWRASSTREIWPDDLIRLRTMDRLTSRITRCAAL